MSRLYTNIAIKFVLSLLIFLLTLEISARVDDTIRYDAPFFGEYSHESMLVEKGEFGKTGKPNGRYREWRLNSFGFRGDEIELDKQAGIVRVVCVGASETFGHYEKPGYEWPAQLDAILNKEAGGSYEVINTAFPGRFLRANTAYLKARISRFSPDIVILYQLTYDYTDPQFPRNSVQVPDDAQDDGTTAKAAGFVFTSRIKPMMIDLLKNHLPERVAKRYLRYKRLTQLREAREKRGYKELVDSPLPEQLQLLREDLEAFRKACDENGAQLIVGTVAFHLSEENIVDTWRFFPYMTEKGFKEGSTELNQELAEFAKEEGVPCIDIASLVPGDDQHMGDYVHFTDDGAEIVANAFAEAVLSLGH